MKTNIRVISRLDIKGDRLIKGVHLEGLRVVGSPSSFASKYYREGCDELLYIDVVASLYERSIKANLIEEATRCVYVPVAAGGGVRNLADAEVLLSSGADKVVVNTAAVKSPNLLTALAHRYGSQAVVCSIEAKQVSDRRWEVFTESGRQYTGLSVIDWALKAESYGAGEILVTSIDREGTGTGFDIELVETLVKSVAIPVIASGGFGNLEHLNSLLQTGVNAVAIADAFHFGKISIRSVKEHISELGFDVRKSYDESVCH